MQSTFLHKINFTCIVILILVACQPPVQSDSELQKQYQQAIVRSQNPTEKDIYTQLTAINSRNGQLERDSLNRIKVVSWTSWEGYGKKMQDTMRLARKVWVTVAPKLQDACSSLKKRDDKVMRISQWLGMPPETEHTHFVEMYVNSEDIFRPCPDPDITDRQCELDFPSGLYVMTVPRYPTVYSTIKDEAEGYPFTGLGYTYDWGSTGSRVGFSEFIVREGAIVYISAYVTTETYCR
ncbi:MAG: hypothetical protein WBB45_08665 [Cyclobacteriaceae bacterium]